MPVEIRSGDSQEFEWQDRQGDESDGGEDADPDSLTRAVAPVDVCDYLSIACQEELPTVKRSSDKAQLIYPEDKAGGISRSMWFFPRHPKAAYSEPRTCLQFN